MKSRHWISNMGRRISVSILLIGFLSAFMAATALGQAVGRTHNIVPEDYFTEVFLTGCVASPDGKQTAFVDYRWIKEEDGRTQDIWVVNNKSKELQRLTFDSGNETNPQWTPDNSQIYFIGHYKQENADKPPYDGNAQVWRINADRTELMPVTKVPDGISDFQLAKDGSSVYYIKDREHIINDFKDLLTEYKDDLRFGHGVYNVSEVWKLDLTTWREKKLVDPVRYIRYFAVSPDQRYIAMITTPDDVLLSNEGWSDVEVFDTASGTLTTLPDALWRAEAPSPHGWLENLSWSNKGDKLAFSVDFDGYPAELFVAGIGDNAEKAKIQKLPRPAGVSAAGWLNWYPNKDILAFLGDCKARTRVYAVHLDDGSSDILTPGDVVVDGFDFVGKKGDLVAIQSELTYYQDLVLYSSKGKSDRLTRLNPQVDTWKLPQISIFKWVGAEGDSVEGILELPPDYNGKEKLPLLVAIHGGPTASDKYCFLFWIYGRASFAAKGYAMLAPNYRGSTGYGDKFMTDLVGHENDYDVKDILTGVDALIAKGIVDSTRMGVSGWSNGGYLTNCLIATNRFKAASSGAGVLDMTVQLLEEDTPGHVINFEEGLPWNNPEEYRKSSPLYSLKPGIKTAVLIHAGAEDERVPFSNSFGLHRMLYRYLDVPCELVIYPGAGHNLTKYTHRLAKMRWDQAWFDRYVLGK